MLYTISNKDIKVIVSSLGATLIKFIVDGKDIVLGFDTEEEYKKNNTVFAGATVGRCANRTAKGTFTLNGVEYHNPINNGPNSLHGGEGLSFKEFSVKKQKDDSITFTYFDEDMNNGYPGNLKLDITYRLDGNTLIYDISGLCDKDSIFNITNHSYFNLDECENSIEEHEFKAYTNKVALNDPDGLSTDKVIDVKNTSFDFTDFRSFKDNFALNHDNLVNGGIDHNFVYENMDDKLCCELRNKDLVLKIKSDLPDMHVYTACGFNDIKGKNGKTYNKYWGVALECQFYPNAINYNGFIKPIIKENKEVKHYISYTVEKR